MRKSLYKLGILCLFFVCLIGNSNIFIHRATAATYTEGKAECVMDMKTGQILHEKAADLCLPMASTTKVLTAITVLECCKDLAEEISILPEAVGIEGSSVYL